MKTLPLDYSRCAGRFDMTADTAFCIHKDTCMRYLAFVELDAKSGIEHYRGMSVMMGVDNCGSKIEVGYE